ncbi:MAG: acetolactate decarboxylase [Bacteroidia bacterium]
MYRICIVNLLAFILLASCKTGPKKTTSATYPDIEVAGAMKNVMWKGELGGIIDLDTISNKKGLYGLGPVSFLTGELLIVDGKTYISRVIDSANMSVEQNSKVEAPFFVYGNANEWQNEKLPPSVTDIASLEKFIDDKTKSFKRPFIFKLIGTVGYADIHIQNLPKGTVVSSPDEAHQGQVNYDLKNEEVEIIGFFSTEHQAVFTHHDSYMHMHLITKDRGQMGHLDKVEFEEGEVELFLPVK